MYQRVTISAIKRHLLSGNLCPERPSDCLPFRFWVDERSELKGDSLVFFAFSTSDNITGPCLAFALTPSGFGLPVLFKHFPKLCFQLIYFYCIHIVPFPFFTAISLKYIKNISPVCLARFSDFREPQ